MCIRDRAYTDHNIIRSQSYQGTYFTTRDDATAFEAMLAQVMDEVTLYESKKYKTQRPIGFINDPANDFLADEPVYACLLYTSVVFFSRGAMA